MVKYTEYDNPSDKFHYATKDLLQHFHHHPLQYQSKVGGSSLLNSSSLTTVLVAAQACGLPAWLNRIVLNHC